GGGDEAFYQYIAANIRYPVVAMESGISGRVYVTFVVEKDGSITDVKVLRGIGGGCDEEAVRVVKAMPKWKPGKQRGRPVRVLYRVPINFTLN
ncbi:MAG: energy transducer TonB, partial [Bacteroidales bacterium]|nr:energy transducer TonB [Bacteroidales bacterium]